MTKDELTALTETHLSLAKSIFNGIWPLLEKPDRTPQEDEDLLLRAFAALYHWKQVGTAVNFQRGYWMISRVFLVLGEKSQALAWALKCQATTEDNLPEMEDFDLAYAQEGLARAYALNGDLKKARKHHQLAADLGKKIHDPKDKEIFQTDFLGGDWFQLGTQ
jgi:hypothetical protein